MGACWHIASVKCNNCMTPQERAQRPVEWTPRYPITTVPTPNFKTVYLKLWHIKVEREISDDNFDIHMRSFKRPTSEEVLKELADKHYWEPNGEEYRLRIEEVTV